LDVKQKPGAVVAVTLAIIGYLIGWTLLLGHARA
jgi:hypothetical protein